jgi:hypothetical protein
MRKNRTAAGDRHNPSKTRRRSVWFGFGLIVVVVALIGIGFVGLVRSIRN